MITILYLFELLNKYVYTKRVFVICIRTDTLQLQSKHIAWNRIIWTIRRMNEFMNK